MSEVSASSAPGYLLASILEESPMSGFSPAEHAPCEPQPLAASFGNFPVGGNACMASCCAKGLQQSSGHRKSLSACVTVMRGKNGSNPQGHACATTITFLWWNYRRDPKLVDSTFLNTWSHSNTSTGLKLLTFASMQQHKAGDRESSHPCMILR